MDACGRVAVPVRPLATIVLFGGTGLGGLVAFLLALPVSFIRATHRPLSAFC